MGYCMLLFAVALRGASLRITLAVILPTNMSFNRSEDTHMLRCVRGS